MAVRELWLSVRNAAGLSSPRAAVDSPRLDETRITNILKAATFWLTPGAVEGFDPAKFDDEFDFLPADEKKNLKKHIESFLNVARDVPGRQPATADQVKRSLPEFTKIAEVFRPDKYADYDAFVIGKRIEKSIRDDLPEWVREMVFETGEDSSGAPALWIWVEVEDEAAESATFFADFFRFEATLRTLAGKVCPDRWPYVRVRTVSDQRPAEVQRSRSKARTRKS
jgi:hypothetical protein